MMAELDQLHPFGQGNPEPIFGMRGVLLPQRPEVFKDAHFRFVLDDASGRRLQGVAWKMADRLPPHRVPIDIAVQLHWNYFNGRKLLQLERSTAGSPSRLRGPEGVAEAGPPSWPRTRACPAIG